MIEQCCFEKNRIIGWYPCLVWQSRASKWRLLWACASRMCFIARVTSAFSCFRMSCLEAPVMPSISLVFFLVATNKLEVILTIATTWILEIFFFYAIKLTTTVQKGMFFVTSWSYRAALHFIRFLVWCLDETSASFSSFVRALGMIQLNRGISTRCVDWFLGA